MSPNVEDFLMVMTAVSTAAHTLTDHVVKLRGDWLSKTAPNPDANPELDATGNPAAAPPPPQAPINSARIERNRQSLLHLICGLWGFVSL